MKKRALLSLALILALLAALYLWYTRPRSFLAITGTSENAVCSAALLLLESWVDDGQAGQDIWELQDLSPGTPAFDALLPLLEKSRWRASLKKPVGAGCRFFQRLLQQPSGRPGTGGERGGLFSPLWTQGSSVSPSPAPPTPFCLPPLMDRPIRRWRNI